MSLSTKQLMAWPEDPEWPDPYGNDPYDLCQ